MDSFKKWLESADSERQKNQASIALVKPNAKDSQLSRYGFLKK